MANKNIDKKYHILYKTTNLINGKFYYGIHSTNNLKDNYLGSGVYLNRAIKKYGKENFKREILYYFDNREELVQSEIDIITEDVLKDKQNMNCQYGGIGFNTSGMVTVRDVNGNCFNVFLDDPRYLSGELVGVTKETVTVKNVDGKTMKVSKNDPRYLSGELVHHCKGMVNVKDVDGNIMKVSINDPRYLSGQLISANKNIITVKNNDGKTIKVSKDDPRYLSGELVGTMKDRKHSEETKNKISKANSISQKGNKNSQYGTCWITKDSINKKIKKELLQSYIDDGWIKGRKM